MRRFGADYWFLLWELTRTEFKLRDQGTLLGFLWTLLHPALIFVVLHTLFFNWLGKFIDQYAAYLIIGLVQWQFFDKATTLSLGSLRRKSNLIRNFKFPSEIIVLSSVGSVFFSYLLELVVLFVFLLFLGVRPAVSWLLLPILIVVHLTWTLGVSLCLALASAEIEDLERVWNILMTAGFYLTPIFYPLSIVSESKQAWMALNPMLHILSAFRGCLLPESNASPVGILAVLLAGIFLLAASLRFFHRRSFWIADKVLQP